MKKPCKKNQSSCGTKQRKGYLVSGTCLQTIFLSIYLSAQWSLIQSDIKIIGTDKFKKQVKEALDLLKEKSPRAYAMANRYIGIIEQSQRSGMTAYEEPPSFQLADRSAFYSITWCAGVIAHDSYHSKLYHDYKDFHKRRVPNEIWIGANAEKKCMKHQLQILKEIGAPAHEIEHTKKTNPNFYDVNQDGQYDWDDYEARDW